MQPDETDPPNRILAIIGALGISRSELARRAGLTRRGLNLVADGVNQSRLDTARKIADALGCSVEWAFPRLDSAPEERER